jgi:hypothetical protein
VISNTFYWPQLQPACKSGEQVLLKMPPQNLYMTRYEFALDRLRALKAVLPSNIVFDLGPGDARMRKIEDEGFFGMALI